MKSFNFGGNPQRFVGDNESKPQKITCPFCGRPVETKMKKKPNWPLFIIVIIIFPLLIFALIEVECMNWMWSFQHFCPDRNCRKCVNKKKIKANSIQVRQNRFGNGRL